MRSSQQYVRVILQASWLGAMLCLSSCVYFTEAEGSDPSYAIPPEADNRIGVLLSKRDQSARALVVEEPRLALTSRLDLIDAADVSIDVQYFIWQNDPSGILVIERLLAAADRGVRVRGLIDDVQLEGLVDRLSAIGDHPNFDVRIFNPFSVRLGFQLGLFRLAEFAIDGNRLNHRMHNKLLVADNQLAILGGRNIGDDYFGLSTERNFIDTDLLISGEVVQELSAGFDVYWNSTWTVAVEEFVNLSPVPDDLESLRDRIEQRLAGQDDLKEAIANSSIEKTVAALLSSHKLDRAVSVVDDPNVSWGDRPDEMAEELTKVALSAERQLLIVSPYLVLTENLLEIAQTLIDRGVKITVVTNSLASNDVVIAHAAYARFRQTIIDAGVELYEFRGDPEMMKDDAAEEFSLHSKYIIFDDDIVFLGSLNLDPRSLYLNTELGVVLESEELAGALKRSFYNLISSKNAWRVISTPDGLRWMSDAGTVDQEPAKSDWQRFRSKLMSLLPLSSQI